MEYFLIVLGALLLIFGLVGCFVPMIPGPPLAFFGLVVVGCCTSIEFSWSQYAWWLFLTVVATVLDFVVPMIGTRTFNSSKWGTRGSLIGTILGLFFLPAGIILGPFLGAIIGEMVGGMGSSQGLKSGFGSLVGFVFGTAPKFAICAYFIYVFISAIVCTAG